MRMWKDKREQVWDAAKEPETATSPTEHFIANATATTAENEIGTGTEAKSSVIINSYEHLKEQGLKYSLSTVSSANINHCHSPTLGITHPTILPHPPVPDRARGRRLRPGGSREDQEWWR